MSDNSPFYEPVSTSAATHFALRWKGRIRYTVPRDAKARSACWQIFDPGQLGVPMRAMASFPAFTGAARCVESEKIELIRASLGNQAGSSACRAGAPGPWQKHTILFTDRKTREPLYVVKAGFGEAVERLLGNEASWLKYLRAHPSLAPHIPELIAQRTKPDLSFVGQSVTLGQVELKIGSLHFAFLRKLQSVAARSMYFEESRFFRTLAAHIDALTGRTTPAWQARLAHAMDQIKQSLSRHPIVVVSAHRDFTPWNVRMKNGQCNVFDWEFADEEQIPMIDPLHFVITPMALRKRPTGHIIKQIFETLQQCQSIFPRELCYELKSQALAYLVGLCATYLYSVEGKYDTEPVLDCYALAIDQLCA